MIITDPNKLKSLSDIIEKHLTQISPSNNLPIYLIFNNKNRNVACFQNDDMNVEFLGDLVMKCNNYIQKNIWCEDEKEKKGVHMMIGISLENLGYEVMMSKNPNDFKGVFAQMRE